MPIKDRPSPDATGAEKTRSFILSRPSRRKLKQSGILKERVFGCDLGEHLLNSGHEIPMVLKCCAEFIEIHGIVDGIYRLSGITSNIQKLRNAFDEDRIPSLYEDEQILQDIHSVSSLLKMYFRELPNPLCTYQLYGKFVEAVQGNDESRLLKMRDVVQQLPPPHYRTLEYVMKHLAKVAEHGYNTGMTPKNVAIVWAPNLLRCKELEVGGVAALQGVGIQAVVTEYLIRYADLIFSDKLPTFPCTNSEVAVPRRNRPKSLAISTPTKLLTLEEARSRALLANTKAEQNYIEVGGGPANLPAKYHTVIELPSRKRGSLKQKKSPMGWKSFFQKSRSSSKSPRKASTPTEINTNNDIAMTETDVMYTTKQLRPVKSAESLISTSNSTSESKRNSQAIDGTNVPSPVEEEGKRSPSLPSSMDIAHLYSPDGRLTSRPSPRCHNRSISHDSYFGVLIDKKQEALAVHFRVEEEEEVDSDCNVSPDLSKTSLDLSEIQINFDLEDSEMRIFSEDETLLSTSFGSESLSRSPVADSEQSAGACEETEKSPQMQRGEIREGGGTLKSHKLSFRQKFKQRFTSPPASRKADSSVSESGTDDSIGREARGESLRRTSNSIREKIYHALSPDSMRRKAEISGVSREQSPKKKKASSVSPGASPKSSTRKRSKIEEDFSGMDSTSSEIKFIDAPSSDNANIESSDNRESESRAKDDAKRFSSSDSAPEAEEGEGVKPRYEKTVVAEVHATQESSNEEDMVSPVSEGTDGQVQEMCSEVFDPLIDNNSFEAVDMGNECVSYTGSESNFPGQELYSPSEMSVSIAGATVSENESFTLHSSDQGSPESDHESGIASSNMTTPETPVKDDEQGEVEIQYLPLVNDTEPNTPEHMNFKYENGGEFGENSSVHVCEDNMYENIQYIYSDETVGSKEYENLPVTESQKTISSEEQAYENVAFSETYENVVHDRRFSNQRSPVDRQSHDAEETYENIKVTHIAEYPGASYEFMEHQSPSFSGDSHRSEDDADIYEDVQVKSELRSEYQNIKLPRADDIQNGDEEMVYAQVKVFRRSIQEVNALLVEVIENGHVVEKDVDERGIPCQTQVTISDPANMHQDTSLFALPVPTETSSNISRPCCTQMTIEDSSSTAVPLTDSLPIKETADSASVSSARKPGPLELLSPTEECKRKIESEIGRDILRERKMKLELEKMREECSETSTSSGQTTPATVVSTGASGSSQRRGSSTTDSTPVGPPPRSSPSSQSLSPQTPLSPERSPLYSLTPKSPQKNLEFLQSPDSSQLLLQSPDSSQLLLQSPDSPQKNFVSSQNLSSEVSPCSATSPVRSPQSSSSTSAASNESPALDSKSLSNSSHSADMISSSSESPQSPEKSPCSDLIPLTSTADFNSPTEEQKVSEYFPAVAGITPETEQYITTPDAAVSELESEFEGVELRWKQNTKVPQSKHHSEPVTSLGKLSLQDRKCNSEPEKSSVWKSAEARRLAERKSSVKLLLHKFEVNDEKPKCDLKPDVFTKPKLVKLHQLASPTSSTPSSQSSVSKLNAISYFVEEEKPKLLSGNGDEFRVSENTELEVYKRIADDEEPDLRTPVVVGNLRKTLDLERKDRDRERTVSIPDEEYSRKCASLERRSGETDRSSGTLHRFGTFPEISGLPKCDGNLKSESVSSPHVAYEVEKKLESCDVADVCKTDAYQEAENKSSDGKMSEVIRDAVSHVDKNDPNTRQRIERYKEERRSFLREKYRSESFKSEKDETLLRLKQKATSPTRPEEEARVTKTPTSPRRRSGACSPTKRTSSSSNGLEKDMERCAIMEESVIFKEPKDSRVSSVKSSVTPATKVQTRIPRSLSQTEDAVGLPTGRKMSSGSNDCILDVNSGRVHRRTSSSADSLKKISVLSSPKSSDSSRKRSASDVTEVVRRPSELRLERDSVHSSFKEGGHEKDSKHKERTSLGIVSPRADNLLCSRNSPTKDNLGFQQGSNVCVKKGETCRRSKKEDDEVNVRDRVASWSKKDKNGELDDSVSDQNLGSGKVETPSHKLERRLSGGRSPKKEVAMSPESKFQRKGSLTKSPITMKERRISEVSKSSDSKPIRRTSPKKEIILIEKSNNVHNISKMSQNSAITSREPVHTSNVVRKDKSVSLVGKETKEVTSLQGKKSVTSPVGAELWQESTCSSIDVPSRQQQRRGENISPPKRIKDMTALFERSETSDPPMLQRQSSREQDHKGQSQYLSSV